MIRTNCITRVNNTDWRNSFGRAPG